MNFSYRLAALLILLFVSITLNAQLNQPPSPSLNVVSVDPATNDVSMKWTSNIDPSFPLDYHIPRKLEYPRIQPIPTSYPIGAVVPFPAPFVNIPSSAGTMVNVAPQAFCLTAKSTVPTSNESAISDYHFPVYLSIGVDTCSAQALLSWTKYTTTNADLEQIDTYHKPFNNSIEYEVWGYKGNPPFNQVLAVKLSDRSKETTFTSQTLEKNKNYFFFIKAYLPQGNYLPNGDEISYSNLQTATYLGIAVPTYINIPKVEVHENSVELNFQIDPTSELFSYTIERTTNPSDGFGAIYDFSDKTLTQYVDTDVNTENQYYYRISATRCQAYVKRSDIANTIAITSEYVPHDAHLKWQSYTKTGSLYSIDRIIPDNAASIISITDSSATDYILPLIQQGYDRFCYRVTATATNGDVSISKPNCFIMEPEIYMPNAIDPTSIIVNATSGAQRNLFGPVIDMDSKAYGYKLTVFNRWGVKVFEANKPIGTSATANSYWNGMYKNKLVEPGEYLYTISIYFPNSQTTQKGSISVFY